MRFEKPGRHASLNEQALPPQSATVLHVVAGAFAHVAPHVCARATPEVARQPRTTSVPTTAGRSIMTRALLFPMVATSLLVFSTAGVRPSGTNFHRHEHPS